MAQRCMAEYNRSGRYPQCTSDAVFHFQWTGNPDGRPQDAALWHSWSCAQHAGQIIRFASAMKYRRGEITVEEITD